MGLKSIQKESVPDQVYSMLKKEIMLGTYQVGTKLPSETELCRVLNVSRVSVRSALQKLSVVGLVETRVGDGNYVKEFDFSQYIDNIGEIIIGNEDLKSLAEYRRETEYSCAVLAMERASMGELEELYKMAGKVDASYKEKDLQGNLSLDLNFHYRIYQLSKNKIYQLSFLAFGERMYKSGSYHLKQKYDMEGKDSSKTVHQDLVRAIKEKDVLAV